MLRMLIVAGYVCLAVATGFAQQPAAGDKADPKADAPAPTIADFAYAHDSERQCFDFWRAASPGPAPLVLMIHGGGWMRGDKSGYHSKAIQQYLDAGVSVAAVNYRFILQAMEQKVEPPVKACLYDAARALQTLRAHAGEWNIDPARIGATGGSAGACTSLWLALHDDLADPQSDDPVSRQSTRLWCAAVEGAQSSLDPEELRRWIPNAIYGGHAFGFAAPGRSRAEEFDLLLAHRQDVLPWIKEYSPIEWASADDPPIYLRYSKQDKPPMVGQVETDPTHSAMYGVQLAERLSAAGATAIVAYPGHEDERYGSIAEFLLRELKR
ncbi:MAG: alpha/beta hydrolase [Pirellulales bacterium]|nr:alpha/beta hydrolase [Pirellulales bacterium]